jgi:transposase InsO family protein
MAHSTWRLIRDLEMVLSSSRRYRPTDNSRREHWYRTAKQEGIYCYPTYPAAEISRLSLGQYIHHYNEEPLHQALWNYPPGYVVIRVNSWLTTKRWFRFSKSKGSR